MRKKGSKGLAKRFCVPKRRNAHKPQKGKENICQKASIPKSLISEQTPTPRTTKDNSRPDNETTAQDGSQTTFNEFDVEPAPVLDGNLTSGEEGKVLLDIALLPISSRCIPAKCMGDETVPTDGHETFVDESLVIEVVQNEASFKVATEFSDSNATASHPKLISSDMWQQVQRMIQPHLPSYCQTSVENGCFHILVFNKCINKVVLRSIAVKSDGHVSVHVQGKILPANHTLWSKVLSQIPLDSLRPLEVCSLLILIYNAVRDLRTCGGVSLENLMMFNSSKCYIEEVFEGLSFKKTLRSCDCLYLVRNNSKRCVECNKLMRSVRRVQVKNENF